MRNDLHVPQKVKETISMQWKKKNCQKNKKERMSMQQKVKEALSMQQKREEILSAQQKKKKKVVYAAEDERNPICHKAARREKKKREQSITAAEN